MQILRETWRRGRVPVVLGSTALVALLTLASPAGAVVTQSDGTPQSESTAQSTGSRFTFAVIPDTQRETKSTTDPRFANRTAWLARNKQALNLQFAIQVGDLVDWDTPDHHMYRTARSAMDVLHAARIPYTIAPGNHDTAAVCPGGSACDVTTTPVTIRDTSTLNRFFRRNDLRKVREQFEPGKIDNAYSRYRIGGREWGVLSLELWPRPEVVAWARTVVAHHPDATIMVVTHSYLNSDGTIKQGADYGSTSPQYLFDTLIKQYPQIKMVFSGHAGTAASRVDIGVHGNTIYSFLQCFHDDRTNPVRLVTVDTAAGTLTSRVYAPFTDQSWPQYATSASGVTFPG